MFQVECLILTNLKQHCSKKLQRHFNVGEYHKMHHSNSVTQATCSVVNYNEFKIVKIETYILYIFFENPYSMRLKFNLLIMCEEVCKYNSSKTSFM